MSLFRVTIVSRIFEPEGGAAAYRLGALSRSLQRAGVDVTVLTTQTRPRVPSTRRVRRWPVLRDSSGAVRGYVQYLSFDIPAFFRLLFGPRADLVVVEPPPTTGVIARVACWLRRTPYVYFSADVSSTAARGVGVNPAVVAVVRWMESWVLRGASHVLAVSPGVRDEVIELGAATARVTMVGTGIDTTQFSRVGGLASSSAPYFVYSGTMSEIQGAGVFVDAFGAIAADNPDVRLLMFGAGVEREQLEERAARVAPGQVDFLGVVRAAELAPWLRGARAGLASVRPSRGYDFAFATKALVSLSCGTPVIYAGVGPMRALITDNELGWAVDWDAAAVAAVMTESLAVDPDAARSERLSAWVAHRFSLDAVADTAVAAMLGSQADAR